MNDNFFTKRLCERCHKSLDNGRTMSIFNTQCICLECAEKEKDDPQYNEALEMELAEIKKGNYNYKGLRG